MRSLFPLATTLLLIALSGVNANAKNNEEILLDFEGDGFSDWKVTGDAFGLGPSVALPSEIQGTVRQYCQNSFGCSAVGGLRATGTILSPEITLKKPYLSFRIGGQFESIGIEMQVDNQIIHQASPRDSLILQRVTWDVSAWIGRKVRFRIFDESEYDFLLIDHLIAHDYANPIFPNSTRNGNPFEPGLKNSPLSPGLLIPEDTTAQFFATHEDNGVTSPTALTVAEDGKLFVAESNRFRHGVEDNRDHLYWLLDDIASRSVEDRRALHKKWQHQLPLAEMTKKSEKIRWLKDSTGDGHADQSGIFATQFNDLLDGTAAGILAYDGVLFFACIPNIWALSDFDSDGQITDSEKVILQNGFGVRVSLSGHDLNGFVLGPDGRLYGTVGDRGLHLTTEEGTQYSLTDQGAAFRFEPDGSNFEIFHTGLRNPKEIAFNEIGDAFSVDNNADFGDLARIVYLVDGADSGWRTDHQTLHSFHRQIGLEERPPNRWTEEKMWDLAHPGQPASILPPIAHLSNGPSGLTFQPGTALGGQFENQFFLCDYKGGPAASGVYNFTLEPNDSSYRMTNSKKFLWGLGVTDIDFGFQGQTYLSDFVTGWKAAPQGRILTLQPSQPHPQAEEVAQLIAEGFHHRSAQELKGLLSHPDQRVRLRAQFALAAKPEALPSFFSELHLRNKFLDLPPENLLLPRLDRDDELFEDSTPIARLHSIWGLGMLARKQKDQYATAALLRLLKDENPEIRAQAAKTLGEAPVKNPTYLLDALKDSSLRVRFFAALSLGRLSIKEAFDPLLQLALQAEDNNDVYLRHAAVVGLAGCASEKQLQTLSGHALPPVRMLSLLALHRLKNAGISHFLFDHTPTIQYEAIRLIHDTPIEGARPALITILDEMLEKEKTKAPLLIWRRLIHSAFRLSGEQNAARLLTVAESSHIPLSERREAMRLLLQWTTPHPVDQSLGRYAPLKPRPTSDLLPLLKTRLAPLLEPEHPLVKEAIALVAHYKTGPADLRKDQLVSLTNNQAIDPDARITALSLLAENKDYFLPPLLTQILDLPAANSAPPSLRLKALSLLIKRQPESSFPYLRQALVAPEPLVRQGAASQLATHPHQEVPQLIISYFNRLRKKEQVDHTIELEMTLAARVSPEYRAHEALENYQKSLGQETLLPFIDALNGGDPNKGKKLFASHPTAQCSRCHLVNPKQKIAGMAGPHLSNIGNQPRRYLLEALVNPSAAISPQFALTTVELENGKKMAGTLVSTNEQHLDLLVKGVLLRIERKYLKSETKIVSAMPPMGQILPKEDLRDLVAYLATLKDPTASPQPLPQEPKSFHPAWTPNFFYLAEN